MGYVTFRKPILMTFRTSSGRPQDSSALIHGYPVLEIVQTLLAMSLAWRSVKFAEARACVYLMVAYVGMRMAT